MYSILAHEIATAHGFHDEKKSDAHWLCLVISEVMEAVEADRKDYRADMIGFIQNTYLHPDFAERYEAYIKGSVEEELADALLGKEDAQSGSCSENSAASDGNKQAAASAKEKEETGNGDQS